MKFPQTFPVTAHTDFVGEGSTFVVINGYKTNGIQFIPKAISRGAQTIIIEDDQKIPHDIKQSINGAKVNVITVFCARKALAEYAARAAGFPAKELNIIGITGTKGKTTTAYLLEHMLRAAGHETALLSTVANKIGTYIFSASLTTPQPDYLHQFFKLCVENNVEYVVMEVAAQAMPLYRVHGIEFDQLLFTNFGHEHLEFFDSMDQYFDAKKKLFDFRKPNGIGWINDDDDRVRELKYHHKNIRTFGLNQNSDVTIRDETKLLLQNQTYEFDRSLLPGTYNSYNIAAAAAIASQCKISGDIIQKAINSFPGIPGRLERYTLRNGATGIIDYAHNPLSYQALLPVLRAQTDHLIVLFGAGGERDASRRPLMGTIASQYADLVIITSDNPRSEDPTIIINNILVGIEKEKQSQVICETDRKKAIEIAYKLSRKNSIIALLGKGPDEYQIIGNNRFFFSEKAILQKLI